MFSRQVSFLGKKQQEKIRDSIVTIIGLGALGSAVAHLLVRMGVEKLILVDNDVVDVHNLSRQHVYTQEDVKSVKVVAAKKYLLKINPSCDIQIVEKRVESVQDLVCAKESSIIVDGLDNHASRRIIDDFCKQEKIPWVHGAAIQDKGSVFFFNQDTLYESIYSHKANDTHCDISGVLATATTLVATIQAQLVIEYCMGKDIPKELFRVDLSTYSLNKIKVK